MTPDETRQHGVALAHRPEWGPEPTLWLSALTQADWEIEARIIWRQKVRALTVRQPWASAIAAGRKRIEFRSWVPPAAIQDGEPFAIHAGKAFDEPHRDWLRSPFHHWETFGRFDQLEDLRARLPIASIVAVVFFERFADQKEILREVYRPDDLPRHGWRLKVIARMAPAIPAPFGKLGLWHLPEDIAEYLSTHVAQP